MNQTSKISLAILLMILANAAIFSLLGVSFEGLLFSLNLDFLSGFTLGIGVVTSAFVLNYAIKNHRKCKNT